MRIEYILSVGLINQVACCITVVWCLLYFICCLLDEECDLKEFSYLSFINVRIFCDGD